MSNYGQELLNEGLDRLEGTWSYNGEEYDLLVEDINYKDFRLAQQYAAVAQQINTLEQKESVDESDVREIQESAEELEDFSWEDEGDTDFVESLISEKLIKPEVDLEGTSVSKLKALVGGMMEAWGEEANVQQAKEEMPLEGNP